VVPRSRLKTALLVILGIVAATAGLDIAAVTLATLHFEGNVSRVHNAFPTTGPRPSKAPAAADSVTFLLTAVEPDGTARTGLVADSVMLVRLTADSRHTQVVFLPVDLWLAPEGRPAGTVGGMLGDGGPAELIGAIEAASGVRIDHYAQLDFDGFRTVTDAVGGLDVNVPANYASEVGTVAAGRQHLDGAETVAYLRAAQAADRAGKTAREQLVMKALFTRLTTIGALSHLSTLTRTVGALTSALSVDSTLDDPGMVRLAWDHRGAGSPDFVAAPVSGRARHDGRWVHVPDDQQLAQLWADLRADDLADHLDDFR
jgi:LCP family protein required for cell wall assembly